MSGVTDDRWTCPVCGGTVYGDRARRDAARRQPCPHGTARQEPRP